MQGDLIPDDLEDLIDFLKKEGCASLNSSYDSLFSQEFGAIQTLKNYKFLLKQFDEVLNQNGDIEKLGLKKFEAYIIYNVSIDSEIKVKDAIMNGKSLLTEYFSKSCGKQAQLLSVIQHHLLRNSKKDLSKYAETVFSYFYLESNIFELDFL